MIRSILLVAAIVSLAEGAALVRFINTVPTRFAEDSVQGPAGAHLPATLAAAPATRSLTNRVGVQQGRSDRVGLQYFAQAQASVAAPTLVWTTIVSNAEIALAAPEAPTAPYAWFHAMPALRAYHTTRTSAPAAEAVAIDKPFGARRAEDNNGQIPSVYDNYEQSRLRADGVGLYLSFAAGTYRMQAYAAMSNDQAQNFLATARPFADSSIEFTFADNKVYTIIAYGNGRFAETVPLNGNNVRLTLLEESIAPVTFGMAAVRFFNAFTTSNVAMDVYQGSGVSDSGRIATGVAVGTVSNYIDVTPGVQKEFPVAQTGSTANYLASNVATQRDVRAGSRQTIICAVNNDVSGTGFCRGIPSRVVAYVRLINDLTAQDSLVQGAFGAQKLSQTRINLWASYEVPRPEIVVEGSQVSGTNKVTGHPATQEGLYPVLVNVAPGTVTGYSEVYVPVYIMDFAVRRQMHAPARVTIANDVSAATYTTDGGYVYAPVYKRVHYILKTDGGATLSARQALPADVENLYEFPLVGLSQSTKAELTKQTINANSDTAFTIDEYVEPGEYYSVFATAHALDGTAPVYAYPRSDIFQVNYRRDRTVDAISSGLQAGKGSLNLVPMASQVWTAATLSLQTGTTTTAVTMATVAVSTATVVAGVLPIALTDPAANEILLTPGAYTYTTGAGTDCLNTIPSSNVPITIAEGGLYDLFVLNSFGCKINGPSVSRLNVVIQQRAAVAAANAPVVQRRHPVPAAL